MAAPIGSTTRIDSAGKTYPLDVKPAPAEVVTEDDAKEPKKVARILGRLLADVAALRRRFAPARIDFEGVICGTIGQSTQILQHNFNGAARWWVVGWTGATAAPALVELAAGTTANTLQFQSYAAGVACIRVEVAG